tara:strand:- start:595 stop:876 length:282 start_codon:yes stop_codon:yes gene_type:complete
MKTFKDIKEQALRQNFRKGNVFTEGKTVMNVNTGAKGKIIRTGPNYVICVTESNEMFRAWVRDIREVNEVINKPRRTLFFTHGQANTINISAT